MEVKAGKCLCGDPERVVEENGNQVMYRCPLYIKLRGANPQGGEIDEWGCSISWIPILLIENAQEMRQTAAAIESFRNEMVQGQQVVLRLASNGKVKEISDARDNNR